MSDDFFAAVDALAAGERRLGSRDVLFRQGDRVDLLFTLREGALKLIRFGESGTEAVLQRARAGSILAEASWFADVYHCDAVATEPSCVGVVERATLTARADELMPRFARYLAAELQRTRHRAELLTCRGVSERLDGWLALHGGRMPARGLWRTIAEDMAVTPEALYRELARRREGRQVRTLRHMHRATRQD